MTFVLPKPKIVRRNGKPSEVILSYADWQKIVAALDEDDADDMTAVETARREDDEFASQLIAKRGAPVETTIPLEIIKAKLEGVHPLKAWREFRELTQRELSTRSGVGSELIAQIETDEGQGSVNILERLARALGIPMEALIEEAD
jgi:hypothetical protein